MAAPALFATAAAAAPAPAPAAPPLLAVVVPLGMAETGEEVRASVVSRSWDEAARMRLRGTWPKERSPLADEGLECAALPVAGAADDDGGSRCGSWCDPRTNPTAGRRDVAPLPPLLLFDGLLMVEVVYSSAPSGVLVYTRESWENGYTLALQ